MGSLKITSIGNAGFHLESGSGSILIDPVFNLPIDDRDELRKAVLAIPSINLVLVTHSHWDHCDPSGIGEIVGRTGAVVIGPHPVVLKMRTVVPAENILELQPETPVKGQPFSRNRTDRSGISVTAFATLHGSAHNSYLIDFNGWRILHDGDNEFTQPYRISDLTPIDILLLCPWQGSGWADFVETVKPGWWILQHLDGEEVMQHWKGQFFPSFCDDVPGAPIAIQPGEHLILEKVENA